MLAGYFIRHQNTSARVLHIISVGSFSSREAPTLIRMHFHPELKISEAERFGFDRGEQLVTVAGQPAGLSHRSTFLHLLLGPGFIVRSECWVCGL